MKNLVKVFLHDVVPRPSVFCGLLFFLIKNALPLWFEEDRDSCDLSDVASGKGESIGTLHAKVVLVLPFYYQGMVFQQSSIVTALNTVTYTILNN